MFGGDDDGVATAPPNDAPSSVEVEAPVVASSVTGESPPVGDPPTEPDPPRVAEPASAGETCETLGEATGTLRAQAAGQNAPPTLFQLCLRTIARKLECFCNTRLYPTNAPALSKPFEQALSVYDLAPLTLLDEQRCLERILAMVDSQLRARRAKFVGISGQHRLEVVPTFALSPDLEHDTMTPLKIMLSMLPSASFEFRSGDKYPTEVAERLRKLEDKWVSGNENRPPENVDADSLNPSSLPESKHTPTTILRLLRQTVTNTGCGLIAVTSAVLRRLDLSNSDSKAFRGHGFDNNIRDTGACALAVSLEINRSVVFLSLSNNLIGQRGGTALANMIRKNTTLRHLELSKTSIKDAADELIEGFRRSKTLDTLNLQWCGLRPGLGAQLATVQAAKAMRQAPIATQLAP